MTAYFTANTEFDTDDDDCEDFVHNSQADNIDDKDDDWQDYMLMNLKVDDSSASKHDNL